MIIDHTNAILFGHKIFSMVLIGRGTFPLFCYAVAIAVLKAKTDMPLRYVKRMLILALVAQPVYYFAMDAAMGNVIFTLAAGALLAALTLRLKSWQIYMIYAVALFSMLWPFPVEFGLAGVALPSAIVLALRGEKSVYPFLLLLTLSVNAADFLSILEDKAVPTLWGFYVLLGLGSVFLPLLVLDLARSLRQTGRLLPKYALHIFYPGHLALLKAAGMLFS